MADYRRAYTEKIFNCFPGLNQPIFTPFGNYIVHECDPDVVSDAVVKVLKTVISPRIVAGDPRLFSILNESKMIDMEVLMKRFIPSSIKSYHISSILKSREDCGPLRCNSNQSYLTFGIRGRKEILREAFLSGLPNALGHSKGWVSVETLIQEERMVTDKVTLIREYIQYEFVAPKTDEIELKQDAFDGTMSIRCTGKKRRLIDEDSKEEGEEWSGSWENIGVFDSLREVEIRVKELERIIYHLPSNAFDPLPSKLLFRGATLMHGNHHGLLISIQTLQQAFGNRSSRGASVLTKITVRESEYVLPIYNIPGTVKSLHVAFVRVADDLEGRERKYYDMPIFLYDGNEYNIRTRGADANQVLHYLDKIDREAPDSGLPEYDCCEFELGYGYDCGCFQCTDEECFFS